jgi:hypothetical protein
MFGIGFVVAFLARWLAVIDFDGTKVDVKPYSHWSLLSDLNALPDALVEPFLHQISDILINHRSADSSVIEYLTQSLEKRCGNSLSLTVRLLNVLEVSRFLHLFLLLFLLC